ncbi:hypothetical protein ACL02U_23305 [Streptomyces sp. MS06]|uniref:SPW repeat domain-containing protein n=1 Tax=Streptomyces sp. MS06 TaxID=3385974 RepID=UPI0039A3D216
MMQKPLTDGTSPPVRRRTRVRPGALRAEPLTVLMLLTGVWLLVTPWLLPYPVTYRLPHLVETCVGVVVSIVALVRLAHPRGRVSDLVVTVAGAGLILTAYLGGYGGDDATRVMRVNETAAGSVLVLLALASTLLLTRSRSGRPRAPDGPPR